MPRSPLLLLACLALCACPGPGLADGEPWVRVGQRWRFEQPGLPDAEQVFLVTAVSAARVDYEVQAYVGGEPVGERVLAHYPRHPAPAWEGEGEDVIWTVSGLRLPCQLREGPAGRVWTAGRAGPEFPGVVRATDAEGQLVLELVEVEFAADE